MSLNRMVLEDLWGDNIDVFAEKDADFAGRRKRKCKGLYFLGLMLRKNPAWPQLQ